MVAPAGLRMEEAGREGELHRTLLIGAQAALEVERGGRGEGGGNIYLGQVLSREIAEIARN